MSLSRALTRLPKRERRSFQLRIVEQLSYTVLYHAFAFREIHGDLHPGNLMIGADGSLNLIDWGNVVDLHGKWGPVWDYLAGAILADTELLTDALIRISTQPEENLARRDEIRAALDDTLRKKGVTALTRRSFVTELRAGGVAGLHRRGQAVLQLMANTQQTGMVLKRDYLHLSRAVMALAGSYGTLYEGDRGGLLLRDLGRVVLRLPLMLGRELTRQEVRALLRRLRPAEIERARPAIEPERPRPARPSLAPMLMPT